MAEDKDERAGGMVFVDLIIRIFLLLWFPWTLGDMGMVVIGILALYLILFAKRYVEGLLLFGAMLVVYFFGPNFGISLNAIPATIYALASIISIQLLPLSAFPVLETAATYVLWVFIGLIFAGTSDWKEMLMMLAIGGLAMGFIGSLGIFAVADAEVTASYTDLVQHTKVKNTTASTISNFWLMISNPRLWYEQQYGYKNETLAQGDQTSPVALEISKADIVEKVAPPGGEATLDIQVRNYGKRDAMLKVIDANIEEGNLGHYRRYTKTFVESNPDKGYLYFESTPTEEADYTFCDNPEFKPDASNKVPEGFTVSPSASAQKLQASQDFTKGKTVPGTLFESGVLDEYFAVMKSPECYGQQKTNATITYAYNVTATYNLELIGSDYYKELARYNKLKFHKENSISSEGPLKLTIRSVPEDQPIRLRGDGSNTVTIFYSLSNLGPGTVVIPKDAEDAKINVYLESYDKNLIPPSDPKSQECDFGTAWEPQADGTYRLYLKESTADGSVNGAEKKLFMEKIKEMPGVSCKYKILKGDEGGTTIYYCPTIPSGDLDKIVLFKCAFKYDGPKVDTINTLFTKMHVDYAYITAKNAQYETIQMPEKHGCVTKRALDGFPNKTMMDLYIKELYKGVTVNRPAPFGSWSDATGFPTTSNFCT